jgi:hypothetical protein
MLNKSGQVYGWPNGGYPFPQGPFYCGVGSESVYGRPLAEAHMDACIKVSPPPLWPHKFTTCQTSPEIYIHSTHHLSSNLHSEVRSPPRCGLGLGKRSMCPGVSRRGDLLLVFRAVNARGFASRCTWSPVRQI